MVSKKSTDRRIVITGGGSGGHVSVSLGIIQEIKKTYDIPYENLLYIGGDLGMEDEKKGSSIEQKRFKNVDFQTEYIRAGKLQRSFSFRSISLLTRTVLGFFDSIKVLKRFNPNLVISTGGFVSVPVCMIAHLKKIPIYLHEQTAAVGLSNKIVSKYAKKIFVTFKESIQYFPSEKTIHTGNIVRNSIFRKSGEGEIVEPLKKMILLQEKYPIIYISGGGQGSHVINNAVREALPQLLQDFQVILQTGDNRKYKDYNLARNDKKKLTQQQRDRFLPVKYVKDNEIGFLLNNIDLFVGRSGANTTYEMGLLRIPSLLIPIPWVTHNEQELNANVLVDIGLGKILPEAELSREKLVLTIKDFWKECKEGLSINTEELTKRFPRNAVEIILKEIDELQ